MIETRQIRRGVEMALDEDAPHGDLTSEVFVPSDAVATADLVAREPGVFSGGEVFRIAMTAVDATVEVHVLVGDGDAFEAGARLATVTGPGRAVLRSERIALNLV